MTYVAYARQVGLTIAATVAVVFMGSVVIAFPADHVGEMQQDGLQTDGGTMTGDLSMDDANIELDITYKLIFDADDGGNSYLYGVADDLINIVSGGDNVMLLDKVNGIRLRKALRADGNFIGGSSTQLELGSNCSSNHSGGVYSVCAAEDFEVHGAFYVDHFATVTGDALTSGGTDDYTLSIAQTLNDTGAAGGSDVYRGIKLDITQTDITGWDSVYLMDLMADASSVFTVTTDGGLDVYDSSGNGFYWQEFHIDAGSISPGGSGATLTVWNTSTIGWLLDATTEYLYLSTEIHDDWEGSSDHVIEAFVCLNAAETANDIIQAEVIAEYFGEHDDMDTPKTQTRSINHDIVNDNGAGECHTLVFILDWDLVDHVIEVEDQLKIRFRLDSVGGGTDVAAVRSLYFNHKYRTSKPNLTAGTFPTEG